MSFGFCEWIKKLHHPEEEVASDAWAVECRRKKVGVVSLAVSLSPLSLSLSLRERETACVRARECSCLGASVSGPVAIWRGEFPQR